MGQSVLQGALLLKSRVRMLGKLSESKEGFGMKGKPVISRDSEPQKHL